DEANAGNGKKYRHAITAQARTQLLRYRSWQRFFCQRPHLRIQMRMGLAHVVTATIERAAERTDRRGISRAPCHVLRLERMLADGACDRPEVLPFAPGLARQIVPAFR